MNSEPSNLSNDDDECSHLNVIEKVELTGYVHAKPEDRDQCEGNEAYGQCRYRAVNGTKYCPKHGGNGPAALVIKKEKARNYNLTRYRDRVHGFADNPEIKSLREEIGIVRLLLESIVNKCEGEVDLLINTDRISTLVSQIDRLVTSCHRIEEKTGGLLDKSSILVLCDGIVKIISEQIEDVDKLDTIANGMVDLVNKMGTIGEKMSTFNH